MGFLDIFRRAPVAIPTLLLEAKAAPRPIADLDDVKRVLDSVLRGGSMPTRGSFAMLAMYAASPTFHRGVSLIANGVAAQPIRLYKPGNNNERTRSRAKALKKSGFDNGRRHKTLAAMIDHGDLIEVYDSEANLLLEDFMPTLTAQQGRFVSVVHNVIRGEGAWVKGRPAPGKPPIMLLPCNPDWIQELPSPTNGYQYKIHWKGGDIRAYPANDVIFFRTPDPTTIYGRGLGVGAAVAPDIDVDRFIMSHLTSFFYNAGAPSVIVNVPGASNEQVDRIEDRMESKFRGEGNAHQAHVTNAQDLKVEVITQKMADQETVEIRELANKMTRIALGVPAEIMGDTEHSERATVKTAEYIFARRCLVPVLENERATIQRQLIRADFGETLIADYDDPVPEDEQFRLQAMKSNPHTVKVNDWRRIQGLDAIPDDAGGAGVFVAGTLKSFASITDAVFSSDDEVKPTTPTAPLALPPHVDDGENDPVELRARKGLRGKGLTANEVDVVANAVKAERLEVTTGPITDTVRELGQDAVNETGIDAAFDMLNPMVINHVAQYSSDRITKINSTTRKAVRNELLAGVALGESSEQLAARVKKVFSDADKRRSLVIARTEVMRSSNFGRYVGFDQTGLASKKRWLHALRGESRPLHKAMHGKSALFDADFVLGNGKKAQHPHAFNDPAEDIQCRCTFIVELDVGDDDEDGTASINGTPSAKDVATWNDFDALTTAHEAKIAKAFVDAFALQLEDTLEMLSRLAR